MSIGRLLLVGGLAACLGTVAPALAQSTAPAPASPQVPASSATPKDPAAPAPAAAPKSPVPEPKSTPTAPPATPDAKPPAPSAAPAPPTGSQPLAPAGKPQTNEIEPNASPSTPRTATTETVDVPTRPIVFVKGQSSYDDAFKSIKASQDALKAAMDKAGLQPTGHPITIFSETDDKGFKYEAAVPIAAVPQGKGELTNGAAYGQSPSGQALKFQHRGPYDEIDSTYATITSYLDNKGLQTDSPYIEEYLTDPKSIDDPYLAVDIYIFIKK